MKNVAPDVLGLGVLEQNLKIHPKLKKKQPTTTKLQMHRVGD